MTGWRAEARSAWESLSDHQRCELIRGRVERHRGRRVLGDGARRTVLLDSDGPPSVEELLARPGAVSGASPPMPFESPALERLSERVEGAGPTAEGYASMFRVGYLLYDWGGPYLERMAPSAFDESLSTPGLRTALLIGHAGLPLASTTAGSLALEADEHGLAFSARLDPGDADAVVLASKLERGVVTDTSIGGRITSQEWSDDYSEVLVTGWDLSRGEVSAVFAGANPAGWIALRPGAHGDDDKPPRRSAAAGGGPARSGAPERPESSVGAAGDGDLLSLAAARARAVTLH